MNELCKHGQTLECFCVYPINVLFVQHHEKVFQVKQTLEAAKWACIMDPFYFLLKRAFQCTKILALGALLVGMSGIT